MEDPRLEVDGEPRRIVGAGEVVERPHPVCLRLGLSGEEAGVLFDRQHLALVADRVH